MKVGETRLYQEEYKQLVSYTNWQIARQLWLNNLIWKEVKVLEIQALLYYPFPVLLMELNSLGSILVSDFPILDHAMYQSLSRHSTSSHLNPPADTCFIRICIRKRGQMDINIWRDPVFAHPTPAQAWGIPFGPRRNERNSSPGCHSCLQNIPAIPWSVIKLWCHAWLMAEDIGRAG